MFPEIIGMLGLGFLIGLTGALAPGPTLIATINTSLKGGWSMGPKVTLGHAVVELVMVAVIIAGYSVIIGMYYGIIAGVGGIALILFGILTITEARVADITFSGNPDASSRPFLAGIITSISNPYFWIWWFTVGSALLIGAYQGGAVLAIAFILGHWAADLTWLTLVSVSIHRGRFVLGVRQYRWILGLCGLFLLCFGAYFLVTLIHLGEIFLPVGDETR
jgi:threonine/homoserine/homoserine lactone efflux protein